MEVVTYYLATKDGETIFFAGTPQQLSKLDDIHIIVGNSSIQPSLKIRNFDITFDSKSKLQVRKYLFE